jgi:hypothetical protein
MLPSRVISLVAFLLFPAVLFAADKENDKKKDPKNQQEYESVWMKRKLQMSQQIMEGLSRGDLESVGSSARTMRTLSKIEGWARRSDTKEYRRQLKFFDQANSEVIKQAENDNLNGATLAFTQMTVSCVACHQHLRDQK